jgi:hypothetical protein
MTERSASNGETKQHQIPWEERLEDHNNKKTEYLENCLFRGCNPETTIKTLDSALTSIFNRVQIEDPTHPAGRRPLLCWDLLDPELGWTYIRLISTSLLQDELAPGTRRHYMRDLRLFCEFIVAKPNIPGRTTTVIEKYGPIALNFTKYDLPIHVQDRPVKNAMPCLRLSCITFTSSSGPITSVSTSCRMLLPGIILPSCYRPRLVYV